MTVLLACDLDGTVLDQQGQLVPGVREFIRGLSAAVCVALCSARPPRSVQRVAMELGRVAHASALQGAVIQACSPGPVCQWRTQIEVAIEPDALREVTEYVAPRPTWWYSCREWLVDSVSAAAQLEASIIGYSWDGLLREAPQHEACKLLAIEPDRARELIEEVDALGLPVRCYESKPGYVEVVSAAVAPDKGVEALRGLVDGRGQAVGRVFAIGDGLNDLGMLSAADTAFTFADADPALLGVADVVLPADRSAALCELADRVHDAFPVSDPGDGVE